jgi:hypothetical protein
MTYANFIIMIVVFVGLSMGCSYFLFKSLKSYARIKKREVRLGGAIAGFPIQHGCCLFLADISMMRRHRNMQNKSKREEHMKKIPRGSLIQGFVYLGLCLMLLTGQIICDNTSSDSGALAVSWTGYADTDLEFTEFIGADHTMLLRFMPQFTNAYYAPILAENGSGTFIIGQGDYFSGTSGSKLYVALGSKSQNYNTALNTGQWYTLALVGDVQGTQTTWKVYLNGTLLSPSITVNNSDSILPKGRLRLGKRTTGATIASQNAQYYGLIDDIAVFDRVLGSSEMSNFSAGNYKYTGQEAGLIAAFTFDTATDSKLTRPVQLNGVASEVETSANHNSMSDASLLPLPTAQKTMFLPFAPGEEWRVIQAVNQADGTHKGYAAFCWDFILDGYPQGGEYPQGTKGAPLYAASSGTVLNVDQARISGQSPSNIIEVRHGLGEIAGYLHLKQNSSSLQVNDSILRGSKMALAWDVGSPVGAHHLHFAVHDKQDGTTGFVTFPVAFSNYEVKQPDNTWVFVARGMPKNGDVIRRPLPADLQYRMTAVWKKSSTTEIQVYGHTYASYRAKYDELWPQGWRLKIIKPHIYNGGVRYTAAWEPGTADEIQVYGYSYADYRARYDALWPQGWRLKMLEPYVINNQVRYTAVWRKSDTPEIQVYGYTYTDYRAKYDVLWPQGWRLKLLKPYVINGQVRYTAVWQPGSAGEFQVYEYDYADYRARYDELWPKGWRLKLLETYVINGTRKYTAAWEQSTAAERQLYGAKYQYYRLFYDNIWPDNWCLRLLDID